MNAWNRISAAPGESALQSTKSAGRPENAVELTSKIGLVVDFADGALKKRGKG